MIIIIVSLLLKYTSSIYIDPLTQCTFEDSTLETLISVPIGTKYLVLPDSVRFIKDGANTGQGAFFECRNDIENVEFGQRIEIIGSYTFELCNKIKKLNFPTSVTTINSNCFYSMGNLHTVTFPVGSLLDYIGLRCFAYCSSLVNIETIGSNCLKINTFSFAVFETCINIKEFIFPDSVTVLGNYLFSYCTSLEKVVLPSNTKVTAVMNNTFYFCSSLKTAVLGLYMREIYSEAFSGCSQLKQINVKEGNSYFETIKDENSDDFGVLMLKNADSTKSLIVYPPGKENTYYLIKEGVTTVYSTAFNGCSFLREIEFSSTVSQIQPSAFSDSYNINKFTISASNTALICVDSILYDRQKTVIYAAIPKPLEKIPKLIIPNTVVNIFNHSFCMNYNFETIEFESGNNNIKKFHDATFFKNQALRQINVPSSVDYIGWSCFYLNINLETVSIDLQNSKLILIQGGAFQSCSSLKNFVLPNSITHIGNSIFAFCNNLTNFEFPDSIRFMSYKVFVGAESLTTVKMPSNIDHIPEGTFLNCPNLISVKYPDNLLNIFANAFSGCLLFVPNLPQTVTTIGANAFQNCISITEFNIPESVVSIEVEAFNGCSFLRVVRLPKNLKDLRNSAFYYCDQLEEFQLIKYDDDQMNPNYLVEDGILYSVDKRILYNFPPGKRVNLFKVPDKVTTINHIAFYGARKVVEIDLTNVNIVLNQAFRYTNFKCNGVTFNEKLLTRTMLTAAGVKDEMIDLCPPTSAFTSAQGLDIKMLLMKRAVFLFAFFSLAE